jgi:hypothetical protein
MKIEEIELTQRNGEQELGTQIIFNAARWVPQNMSSREDSTSLTNKCPLGGRQSAESRGTRANSNPAGFIKLVISRVGIKTASKPKQKDPRLLAAVLLNSCFQHIPASRSPKSKERSPVAGSSRTARLTNSAGISEPAELLLHGRELVAVQKAIMPRSMQLTNIANRGIVVAVAEALVEAVNQAAAAALAESALGQGLGLPEAQEVVGRRVEGVGPAAAGDRVDLLVNAEALLGDVQKGTGALNGDGVVEELELHHQQRNQWLGEDRGVAERRGWMKGKEPRE